MGEKKLHNLKWNTSMKWGVIKQIFDTHKRRKRKFVRSELRSCQQAAWAMSGYLIQLYLPVWYSKHRIFTPQNTFLAVSIKLLQLTSTKLVDWGKSESHTFWLKNARRWKRSLHICRYIYKKKSPKRQTTLRQQCVQRTHGKIKCGRIHSSASQHVYVSMFRGSRQGVWTLSCAALPIWQR